MSSIPKRILTSGRLMPSRVHLVVRAARRPSMSKRTHLSHLELHGALRTETLCDDKTFCCNLWIGYPLNVIDCTDYDDGGRRLSAFTARNAAQRFFNYATTLLLMLASPLKISKIDCHGGYFQGKFCMNLHYELALYGDGNQEKELNATEAKLRQHQINFVQAVDNFAGV